MSRRDQPSPLSATSSDEEEQRARARAELGIASLGEGEELIDTETFRSLHARLAPAGEGPGPTADGGARGEPGARPDDAGDELLLEEVAAELPPDEPAERHETGVLEPPRDPAEVAALEAALGVAPDRTRVVELALRLALRHARVAALLAVNRGIVAGLRGQGGGIETRIQGVILSAEVESLFSACVQRGRGFRGPIPGEGTDAQIFRALDRAEAADVAVLPVAIRGRVVNLLYADNGPERLGETSVAALAGLCRCVAAAYERIILARKR